MRLFALALTFPLIAGCAGDSQTAVDDPASTPPESTAGTESGEMDLRGAARLSRVVSPEWERIEEFTRLFYDGELEQLYTQFSSSYREEFSMEALTELRNKMLADYGEEVEVVATRTEDSQGYRAFFRASRFSAGDRLIEVAFVIGPDDTISGLVITPERTSQTATP
jgi:hypothetical protein